MNWIQRSVLIIATLGLAPLYLLTPRYMKIERTVYDVTGTALEQSGRIDPWAALVRGSYWLAAAGVLYFATASRRSRQEPDGASGLHSTQQSL